MTHFAIAELFKGGFEFIEGTKEEIVKEMNVLSNGGSDKYKSFRVFPYSAYQTKRSFKQIEKPKKGRPTKEK